MQVYFLQLETICFKLKKINLHTEKLIVYSRCVNIESIVYK